MNFKQLLEDLNIGLTEDLMETAEKIFYSSGDHVISMVRDEPFLFKSRTAKGGVKYHFSRGNPVGALLAFVHDGKVYIGWSKRHPKLENRSFSRYCARASAIVRALTDNVVFVSDTAAVDSTLGFNIPNCITKALPDFINRATKYYKDKELANVEYNMMAE